MTGMSLMPMNTIDRITYAMTGRKQREPLSAVIHCAKENRKKVDIDTRPEYAHEKVCARTRLSLSLVPDPLEVHHARVERRNQRMQQGLFSAFGEPYKQLGQVELDTKKLTLDILIPGWKPSKPPTIKREFHKKHREKPHATKERPIRTLSGSEMTASSLMAEIRHDQGGMKILHDAVHESNNYIHEVRMGGSYEKMVKRMQEGPEKQVGMGTCMRNLSEHRLSEWESDTMIMSHKYASQDDAPVDFVFLTKVESVIAMLDSVYILLCSIHNLRPKDLKSRVPLVHEYVTSLRFFPCQLELGHAGTGGVGTHSRHSMMRSSLTQGSHLSRGSFSQVHERHGHASRSGMHGRSLAGKKGKLFAGLKKQTPRDADVLILENWDDLLHHDIAKHVRKTSPTKLDDDTKRRMSFRRASKIHYGRGGVSNTLVQGPAHKRPLPPWQCVAANERAIIALKRDPQLEIKEEKSNMVICEEKIQNQRGELCKLQHHISKQVKKQVQDLKRARSLGFYQKFGILGLTDPLYQPTCTPYLTRMANITDQLLLMASNSERKQAAWYKDLISKYPVKVRGDMRVQAAMAKVEKFALHSISESLPSAKESVCLLAMSYPATEMIKKCTQEAFMVVFVEILSGRPELFVQWMNARGIGIAFDWRAKYSTAINTVPVNYINESMTS